MLQAAYANAADLKVGATPARTPEPTNKELAHVFFEIDNKIEKQACKYADCATKSIAISQQTTHGYHNLMTHLKSKHPSYLSDYAKRNEASAKDQAGHFVSRNLTPAENIYSLLKIITQLNMPIDTINNPTWRSMLKTSSVSAKTVISVGHRLVRLIEGFIGKEMKDADFVAVMMDTWGKKQANTSYTAIEGVYDCGTDSQGRRNPPPLLAFTPLLDESSATADSYKETLEATLDSYGLTTNHIKMLIADNCATNKSLARKLGWKFLGCASHRLSLAGKDVMQNSSEPVDKVFSLFNEVRKAKNITKLRKLTSLSPITRNDIRFNGIADGIRRYFELKEHLEKIAETDAELAKVMLTPTEAQQLNAVWTTVLKDISETTVFIQKRIRHLNLAEVRAIFDALIKHHSVLRGTQIDPSHKIVDNPDLENGIIKILNKREHEMTSGEKRECKIFENRAAANDGMFLLAKLIK